MLIKRPLPTALPTVRKSVGGKDVSLRGAFFHRDVLQLSVEVPRALGAAAVVLRLAPDGGEDADYPLAFGGSDLGVDTYTLSLSLAALCGAAGEGLFFFEFLFLRGGKGRR